jgi:hypothetical protein
MRGTVMIFAGLVAGLSAGWVGFPYAIYKTTPQPLAFSHKAHTGDTGGMTCEDCHAISEDGRFAGIPRLENCAACHAAPLGTTAAEKRFIEEFVTPGREPQWAVYARQPENVYFPHAAHVKRGKVACDECHGSHGTSTALRPHQQDRISGYSRDLQSMDDCVDCHRERGLQHSCLDCHK